MSAGTWMVFKRPSGINLTVDRSAGGMFYVCLYRVTRRKGQVNVENIASVHCEEPQDVQIVNCGHAWVIEASGARFALSDVEARRIAESFGVEVTSSPTALRSLAAPAVFPPNVVVSQK